MSDTDRTREAALWRLRWQVRLTLLGLVAERATRAFWPVWTLLLAALAAVAFGAAQALGPALAQGAAGVVAVLTLALLARGLARFRWPRRDDALDRLDATLRGRPIRALSDAQATGAGDAASVAVWQAHVARMAERAGTARAPALDLRVSRADPYALRYVALTGFVLALGFGTLGRVAEVGGLAPGGANALASGPVWEGWVRPPEYTGKPTLYLNDITHRRLELPQGSAVVLRFYGEAGALGVEETVSGAPVAPAAGAAPAGGLPGAEFTVHQGGTIAVRGPGGRTWEVALLPDTAPTIAALGATAREADGRMRQAFEATDDFGVVAGRAEIVLDVAALDRRYGLAAEPEPRAALVLDLPVPFTGSRTEFTEALVDDLSKHPWANLPVEIRLYAEDALGQTGAADPIATPLPGRRFFDPLAAAIIEARRDLLWSATNAPRVAQILRAVTHRPEGFIRNERAFLRLRVALRRLEAGMRPALAPDLRDEVAEALWEVALLVEEGDLASALERLRRAQDRLDEAMRNGANEAEVADLMQELREALDNYMRQLAEEARRNPDQQMSQDMQGMQMTGNQLQEMLDELQRLMEEGRMAEAQELMEMLRQLMENMQVAEGQGQGEGQGEGNQAMRDLAETLRDQQGLSDDAFRDLQEQFNPGREGGEQPGEGQGQGEGRGDRADRPGAPRDGTGDGRGLADRQQALRDRLRGLDGRQLLGEGSERGESGRRALDRAGRAMDDAERALRDGDLPGALDRQAEAMEALREGMRDLGEALAEDMQQGGGQPGDEFGNADPRGGRDPLGRTPGETGRMGTDDPMLPGADMQRRAQDLLDELRRRSADQSRPEDERDYLERLLDRF
jgi:uncharacterized protein (TIGR02302 family)